MSKAMLFKWVMTLMSDQSELRIKSIKERCVTMIKHANQNENSD